jgi:predicted transcriptional regulator
MSGELVIAFIPIKPKYVDRIINGEKLYEFRKASIRPDLTHLIIYSGSPIKKIVGIAEVETIEVGAPSKIWEKTKHVAGISRAEFREYFRGKKNAYAIKLKKVHVLSRQINPEDIKNGFNIPQSYSYVRPAFLHKILEVEKNIKDSFGMTERDRWEYLNQLDEEMLKGGVILSEWCSFIVRDVDIAYANGAYLGAIITSVSGIETYLRSEYGDSERVRLFDLINSSQIDEELKREIHKLRKYRNKWVHVDDPWDDEKLLEYPAKYEIELEKMAKFAIRTLRKTIYENQWV